jgi:hypothetical protein
MVADMDPPLTHHYRSKLQAVSQSTADIPSPNSSGATLKFLLERPHGMLLWEIMGQQVRGTLTDGSVFNWGAGCRTLKGARVWLHLHQTTF